MRRPDCATMHLAALVLRRRDLALAHEQLAHAIARLVRRREHRPALIEVDDLLDVVLAEPDAARSTLCANIFASSIAASDTPRTISPASGSPRSRTCVSHDAGRRRRARARRPSARGRASISVTPRAERAAPRRARRDRSRCGDRGAARGRRRGGAGAVALEQPLRHHRHLRAQLAREVAAAGRPRRSPRGAPGRACVAAARRARRHRRLDEILERCSSPLRGVRRRAPMADDDVVVDVVERRDRRCRDRARAARGSSRGCDRSARRAASACDQRSRGRGRCGRRSRAVAAVDGVGTATRAARRRRIRIVMISVGSRAGGSRRRLDGSLELRRSPGRQSRIAARLRGIGRRLATARSRSAAARCRATSAASARDPRRRSSPSTILAADRVGERLPARAQRGARIARRHRRRAASRAIGPRGAVARRR